MILGADGLPIAGSANASVGGAARGMMRGVVARQAAMFGGEKKPYDYKIQWLEATGTQYIEIDRATSKYDVLTVDMQYTSLNTDQLNGVSGAWGASRFAFGIDIPTSRYTEWYCGIGNLNTWNGHCDTDRHVFRVDAANKTFSVDSDSYIVNYNYFDSHYKIAILARFSVGMGLGCCTAKLFNFELNSIIRAIPVVKDGVTCLYNELYTEDGTHGLEFYYNAGTGSFIPGPRI